jgi:hypothetical protein
MKRLDSVFRWTLLVGLVAAGLAGFAGALALPFFLSAKLSLLAGATAMGFLIRAALKPLGPALAGLNGPDPARAEQELACILTRARPMVVIIWLLIGSAAMLGLAIPV